MEELVKIFGKYFPKEFESFDVNKKEICIENKDLNLEFEEDKINIFEINVFGESKININLSKQKDYLIYISIHLNENSNLFLNIKGKILGKSLLAIDILSNKKSKAKILEKIISIGEYVNITKLIVLNDAIDSDLELDQYYIIFENGKVINLPILKINEKKCKVRHSSKKIKLTEDQIFYLETKNCSKEKIIKLLERSFLEA